MDRLIALVGLRWRLQTRALAASRGHVLALVVALPALALLSAVFAHATFGLARLAERGGPEILLPAVSGAATLFGLAWTLAPFLAGVAATETHDLGKLLPYPVPVPTLVASSLLANLFQPMVVAQTPPLLALALALGGAGARGLVALAALGLAFSLVLVSGQVAGLALHAVSRNRRLHDRALFGGLALGFALSLLPILFLGPGGGPARGLAVALVRRDVFALVPFSWGARAAVHAGRGEALPFLAWAAAATLALAAAAGVAVALAQRLYRGDLDLGTASASTAGRSRMRIPGAVGALVEKDLRIAWRDPRLKVLAFTGVAGPLLLLFLLWQGSAGRLGPGLLLGLASFAGLGTVGSNALALEREGAALLFGSPVDRFLLLAGKNLAVLVLRLPALVAVAAATLLVAGPDWVPAAAAIVVLTLMLGSAVDNYHAILFPVPLAAAGRDPGAPASGMRGLGATVAGLLALLVTLAASAPFAFLVWLPHLVGERWLWALTLPLALAGAGAVYFMATAGAAALLRRREPDLVARLAGED